MRCYMCLLRSGPFAHQVGGKDLKSTQTYPGKLGIQVGDSVRLKWCCVLPKIGMRSPEVNML